MRQDILAEAVARIAHRGQYDKGGHDYILHVERVAALVQFPSDIVSARAVAWLHDVIEDTSVTYDQLRDVFDTQIVQAVCILTRHPDLSYADYISAVKDYDMPLATAVKIADLTDHLQQTDPAAAHLVPRYQRALARLR